MKENKQKEFDSLFDIYKNNTNKKKKIKYEDKLKSDYLNPEGLTFYLDFLLKLKLNAGKDKVIENNLIKYINKITNNFNKKFAELYREIKNNNDNNNFDKTINLLYRFNLLNENFLKFFILLNYFQNNSIEITIQNLKENFKYNENFINNLDNNKINKEVLQKIFENMFSELEEYANKPGFVKNINYINNNKTAINNIFKEYIKNNNRSIETIFTNLNTLLSEKELSSIFEKLKNKYGVQATSETKKKLSNVISAKQTNDNEPKLKAPKLNGLKPVSPKVGV